MTGDDDDRMPFWRSPLLLVGFAGIGLLFALGVVTGVIAGSLERGAVKPVAIAALLGAVGLAALCGWLLQRALSRLSGGVLSPKTRRARQMLIVSLVFGAILGVVLQLGGSSPDALFDGALPPAIAAFAIALWLVGLPIVTMGWWRNIDEHEALAYKDGALAGIYAYSMIAPAWWIGWRGGFLPQPHSMIIFIAVCTVWGIVWMIRRHG